MAGGGGGGGMVVGLPPAMVGGLYFLFIYKIFVVRQLWSMVVCYLVLKMFAVP
jgi:hypothetical protein